MDIRVGNICKFEDFEPIEGRPACFKIGQVTEIKGNVIIFKILLDIWCGYPLESYFLGKELSCPVPGLTFLTHDWPSRIQILG